ncbi:hypothetical protein BD779DRAFT_1681124 [Infundibulicybe gibba]|nr:hypothetical protein BD779DRAFT_1681124 [Infundibulicybe gibba]
MSQEPTSLPLSNLSLGSSESSHAGVVGHLARAAQAVTAIGEAIGGSATIIVNMIQQHVKNKKDVKNLLSDIERSIAAWDAEITRNVSIPPRRTRDKLRRFFQSDSVRETLLEHTEEFRKLRENLQSSCLMEVQRRVDALHETKFLADHLRLSHMR